MVITNFARFYGKYTLILNEFWKNKGKEMGTPGLIPTIKLDFVKFDTKDIIYLRMFCSYVDGSFFSRFFHT